MPPTISVLSFNGTASPDQYGTLPLPGAGTFGRKCTIETLVYLPALPVSATIWAFHCANAGATNGSHGVAISSAGAVRGHIEDDLANFGGGTSFLPATFARLSLVADGDSFTSKLVYLTLPGGSTTLIGSANTNDDPENDRVSIRLGKRLAPITSADAGVDWTGYQCDVRVWDTVRTPSEIEADAFARLAGDEAGLVRYWRCDEGSGTDVAEAVDGDDGTLTNVTWATVPSPFAPVVLVPGRMRGLTDWKRETLGSSRYRVAQRFFAVDGAGEEIDYSDLVTAGGASWTESVDQKVISATVRLARVADGESLAPLVEGSARNTDGASGYAPALYPGRYCRLEAATVDAGETPGDDDFVICWEGRIDEVDFAGRGDITLAIRDLGGWLAETQIEDERTYDTPATPLADLLQAVLDDNPAHPTDPVPTLEVVGDPDWFLDTHTQKQTRLLQALQDLVDQIGWDVRFEYTEASPFALRIIEPRRDVATPDTTWGPGEYTHVPVARINDEAVRNRLRILRRNAAGVLVAKDYVNTVSAGIFGNRWMQIGGDAINAIETEAESDRLADAVLPDISSPEFDHAYRFRFNPYVMLGDFYAFSPNDVQYDVEQTGAVVHVQHELSGGGGWTTIRTSGAPRSGYRNWLAKREPRYPPELLSYSISQDGANASLQDPVVSLATDELRVWAANGASPLDVGGTPLDRYLVAVRKPQALGVGAEITWPVQDGEWEIVMRAYAGQDRYTQVEDDLTVTGLGGGTGGGGTGGPATAPASAPPTPSIAAGAVVGTDQYAVASWLNTNNVDDIEAEWEVYHAVEAVDPVAPGLETVSRLFDCSSFPQRVRVRIRYTNAGGDGPWSAFSPEIQLNG